MTSRASCLENRGVYQPPPQDRSTPMSEKPISPLRRRMIEDMTVRNFVEKTHNDYIRHVRTFTAFLGRAPDNAGHVSLGQLKVISAIESCRTAALGGHVERCEDCSYTQIAYNSCRNRHCPKCQGSQALAWMKQRKSELLDVPYFHVVFTLPGRIGTIAYHNKAVVYDLLFKASSQTMRTIAADPKRLGVKIGFTSVLHTWGSAMTHHPHVHMIVPGGGISLDGTRWIGCRPNYLLPVKVLSRLFRRLMLE